MPRLYYKRSRWTLTVWSDRYLKGTCYQVSVTTAWIRYQPFKKYIYSTYKTLLSPVKRFQCLAGEAPFARCVEQRRALRGGGGGHELRHDLTSGRHLWGSNSQPEIVQNAYVLQVCINFELRYHKFYQSIVAMKFLPLRFRYSVHQKPMLARVSRGGCWTRNTHLRSLRLSIHI